MVPLNFCCRPNTWFGTFNIEKRMFLQSNCVLTIATPISWQGWTTLLNTTIWVPRVFNKSFLRHGCTSAITLLKKARFMGFQQAFQNYRIESNIEVYCCVMPVFCGENWNLRKLVYFIANFAHFIGLTTLSMKEIILKKGANRTLRTSFSRKTDFQSSTNSSPKLSTP